MTTITRRTDRSGAAIQDAIQDRATARPRRWRVTASALAAVTVLGACQDGGDFALFRPKGTPAESGPASTTKLVERDVEAPEVFQVTEAGLWDGRPSLGGVWVAHSDVNEPERVIIRNESNGKFVIGALFRRERDMPGPRLQVSSDAASTLGMLAGKPVELNVTALRREEASVAAPAAETATLDAPAAIEATPLEAAIGASAALDAVEAGRPAPAPMAPTAPVAAPAQATAPIAAPAASAPAKASSLGKPYLQIGIFSVEANAKNAAAQMRNAGMVPTIREQTTQGKTFWRVLVGPAATASEQAGLLKKIKDIGFTDAYAVTK